MSASGGQGHGVVWVTRLQEVVHDFGNYKSALSQGEALAVVVERFPVASRAIKASVKGEGEGSGRGDRGPGERSPGWGF